eukprot:TRINITY_DN7975_c0_g1_i4.p1 TRINITY_DN7975_c0_g1~~TRINITY_DN7975_c0_g1_i4.p1  ORF type:complete len:186 (-),score=23.21 TRINITY_DN7975_c0_g1_i4:172-657(-)
MATHKIVLHNYLHSPYSSSHRSSKLPTPKARKPRPAIPKLQLNSLKEDQGRDMDCKAVGASAKAFKCGKKKRIVIRTTPRVLKLRRDKGITVRECSGATSAAEKYARVLKTERTKEVDRMGEVKIHYRIKFSPKLSLILKDARSFSQIRTKKHCKQKHRRA